MPAAQDKPKPHWLGHRDRLRQKLLARGADALDDYELLETLLFAFLPRRDVKPIAKALLARFGGLSAIFAAPAEDIASVKGMGETSAAYLKATAALSARAAREEIAAKPVISSWTALVTYVRSQLQHETREQFRVLFLDSADIDVTRELIDALTPFEITIHDHLIVGTGGVTSFKSSGLI